MVTDGGKDTWHDISAKGIRDYADCEGDSNINWKNQTYSTILDILMVCIIEIIKYKTTIKI